VPAGGGDGEVAPAANPAPEWRRKLLHLATAVFAPIVLYVPEPRATLLLGASCGLAAGLDLLRLRSPAVAQRFARALPGVFRSDEATRISGATLLLVGYTLTSALCGPRAAATGIVAAAVGDAAAALGGRGWRGRRASGHGRGAADASGAPPERDTARKRKTLAGTVACALAAGAASTLVLGPAQGAVLAGATAAVAERITPRRWDNLTLPLAVAAVVEAALRAAR
jgi:dolichol kinase